MSNQPPNRPEKEFRVRGITAAIWRNEQVRGGQTVVSHSVRVQKRYFDRDSQTWQNADTFFPGDLPRLRLVIDQAYAYAMLHERDPNEPESGNSSASS